MSKQVTVEEASPSPPPLPKEVAPVASSSNSSSPAEVSATRDPADVPVDTLGENSDSDQGEEDAGSEIEEWDPSEERLPGQTSKSSSSKGKGKAVDGETSNQPWQAVWAPEQNAWYFWNSITGEVTWTNPLEPAPPLPNEPAPPPLPAGAPPLPEGRFGQIPDIDPDLAYLLPSGSRGVGMASAGGEGPGAGAGAGGQQASFNARTGRFQQADNTYSIDHLEEWNRAKRQAGHYFDVEAWEAGLREENAKRKRDAEAGVSESKKVSKKDMERFRKKKAEQKLRKQAWLRD